MSAWELIFRLSRVNNATYYGDRLPGQHWQWPQDTWLQNRLRCLRTARARQSGETAGERSSGLQR